MVCVLDPQQYLIAFSVLIAHSTFSALYIILFSSYICYQIVLFFLICLDWNFNGLNFLYLYLRFNEKNLLFH